MDYFTDSYGTTTVEVIKATYSHTRYSGGQMANSSLPLNSLQTLFLLSCTNGGLLLLNGGGLAERQYSITKLIIVRDPASPEYFSLTFTVTSI